MSTAFDTRNLKGKRYFVTGATGFCGQNFVKYLAEHGAEVTCLVRSKSRAASLQKLNVHLEYGELSDEALLEKCIADVDVVFHLAGRVMAFHDEEMLEVNRDLTEKIVQVCARREKPPVLVYVSSLAAMGPNPEQRPHVESDPLNPFSSYGKSKFEAEKMLRGYADRVPITVIRPPSLFGPHDSEVRKWFTAMRRTHLFFAPTRKPLRLSFLHVKDLIQLLLLASENGERLPATPEAYHLDPGYGVYLGSQTVHPSYPELGQMLGRALGMKYVWTVAFPLVYVVLIGIFQLYVRWVLRHPMQPDLAKIREGSAGHWTCSAEKARRQLGFKNDGTLEEQLKETAEWISRN